MHAHARRTGFTRVADAAPATSAAPPVVEPARDHGLAHLCSCSSPSAPSCGSCTLCPVPSPSNGHHRQAFSTAAPPKMSAPMKEHRTSDRAQEKSVRESNIVAAKAVADAVRTSLGPRGMDKMVPPARHTLRGLEAGGGVGDGVHRDRRPWRAQALHLCPCPLPCCADLLTQGRGCYHQRRSHYSEADAGGAPHRQDVGRSVKVAGC